MPIPAFCSKGALSYRHITTHSATQYELPRFGRSTGLKPVEIDSIWEGFWNPGNLVIARRQRALDYQSEVQKLIRH